MKRGDIQWFSIFISTYSTLLLFLTCGLLQLFASATQIAVTYHQISIPKTEMDTIKRLSHWFRGSKQSKQSQQTSNSSQISSSFRSGFYDPDSSSPRTQIRLSPRQVRKPRQCTIDKEYNVVLVPSDGECMSESDSDGSDWSIGWLEPHGSGFELGRHQKDFSFAVLVPCYKTGTIQREASSFNRLSSVGHNARTVSDGESYIEQWLSTLPDQDNHDNHFQRQHITSLS